VAQVPPAQPPHALLPAIGLPSLDALNSEIRRLTFWDRQLVQFRLASASFMGRIISKLALQSWHVYS
jgi:hypothetical protein